MDERLLDGGAIEYSKAADPLASGTMPRMPIHSFLPAMFADAPTGEISLDLSGELKCLGPASSPGLCASFVTIHTGDTITFNVNATSQLYFVQSGTAQITFSDSDLKIDLAKGDLVTLPCCQNIRCVASSHTVLYVVHDAPLLRYLGVTATTPRFRPTQYHWNDLLRAVHEALNDPDAGKRSRISVLLTNRHFPQTMTITHVLWAMIGILPIGANQLPHRHQSVALDYIIDASPGCYTLVAEHVDTAGRMINPVKVAWHSGGAFTTPPGYWHSHHNESGENAYLMPIQDAGLHTFLRTLDIQFHHDIER